MASAKPIDLSELSILTSVKIDSADRMRNWHLLLQYFRTFCIDWQVVVVEQGPERMLTDDHLSPEVVHRFIHTTDAHYKTRNLNLAASLSSRKYLMMCDVDVMLPPAAIELGLQKLREGREFVCPYNGIMVEVGKEIIGEQLDILHLVDRLPFFEKNYDRKSLAYDRAGFSPMYGNSRYDSTGGALMYERCHFFNSGGWNTNMISYGFEDMEMHARIKTLGYELEKLNDFNSYHFEHVRHTDSVYNTFYRTNELEYERVVAMKRSELQAYANNGFRSLRFDSAKEIEIKNDAEEYAIRIFPNSRYDLSDLSIVFVVKDLSPAQPTALSELCDLLENNFRNYDLVIVEIALRKYKYLRNKKHFRYFWLNNSHSISDGVDLALSHVSRALVSLDKSEQMIRTQAVQDQLREALAGKSLESMFSAARTGGEHE